MPDPILLIADIGGTNARFAIAHPDSPGFRDKVTLQCVDYATPELAIRHYMAEVGVDQLDVICFAAAGPVDQGRVNFTNSHWRLDPIHLAATFGIDKVRVINDFEAIALSLSDLQKEDLLNIGGPDNSGCLNDGNYAVIGAGTGLGAAGLLRRNGESTPLVTEAGHIGFAPMSERQEMIHSYLIVRHPRISNERLVSGMGLENIYDALANVTPDRHHQTSAATIFESGVKGGDPIAEEAIELFFEILGQVAGDLVMSLGAYQGIFLGGGIVQRHHERLATSRFRQAFEDKGRLSAQLQRTPTMVILHPQPGLLGAGVSARQLLSQC